MSGVILREHKTEDGHLIAEICLHAERSLNALTLEMINEIQPALQRWQEDPHVVALLLCGSGERAFCAGGDVVTGYHHIKAGDLTAADRYFAAEYRLDHRLQRFPKPIICWGNGYVLGGGLGLMNGCSHRVVTESSRLAMPETAIGLFPDVGASYFLNRVRGKAGLFMGLTGIFINACEAIYAELADFTLADRQRELLLPRLQHEVWQQGNNHLTISAVLAQLQAEAQATFAAMPVPLREHSAQIERLMDQDSAASIVSALLAEQGDAWLVDAQARVKAASPLSLALVVAQLHKARHMTLEQAFQMEMVMAAQACRQHEFSEGVRALLVDKDRTPGWRHTSVAEVSVDEIEIFFTPPWADNPLADL